MNEDKASRYHRLKRRSSGLRLAASALFLGGLLLSGGAVALREAASAIADGRRALTVTIVAIVLCLAHAAITLPLGAYSGFLLERRYGLPTQDGAGWLRDRAKALLLEVIVGTAAAQVVYATLARWPAAWWMVCALVFSGVLILLAGLAPVLLFPLFYRFTPLERTALRDRLVALSNKAGVRVLGVYEWGLGGKSRRANAALVGTGATRRILVSDTLLAGYSDDEIEVILAHEIAHHVHRDIVTSLVVDVAVLTGGVGAAAVVLRVAWSSVGLQSPADVAGMPLVLLAVGATSVAASPLLNALSRRHERRADRYALELTRRPAAFISAMRRLAAQNLAEGQPSRMTLWLFHTHPPFEERIQAARASGN